MLLPIDRIVLFHPRYFSFTLHPIYGSHFPLGHLWKILIHTSIQNIMKALRQRVDNVRREFVFKEGLKEAYETRCRLSERERGPSTET